jgi:hypothetical protein
LISLRPTSTNSSSRLSSATTVTNNSSASSMHMHKNDSPGEAKQAAGQHTQRLLRKPFDNKTHVTPGNPVGASVSSTPSGSTTLRQRFIQDGGDTDQRRSYASTRAPLPLACTPLLESAKTLR